MAHTQSINMDDLAKTLEPLIRRVVREEILRAVKKDPDIFYLNPEMPLYRDMEEISIRAAKGEIELHSDKEVWGE